MCLLLLGGCLFPYLDDDMDEVYYPPHCGNGELAPDLGEECDDGWENHSATEPDRCRPDCRLPRCHDGVVDTAEECARGTDMAPTCSDFGFTHGVARCLPDCQLDVRSCGVCGDGVADGSHGGQPAFEICDGADLRGQTCDSVGRGGGVLRCTSRCTLDTYGCAVPVPDCGNGLREGTEPCDDGNALSHDGCSSDCVAEHPTWAVDEVALPERFANDYWVAYDRKRHRWVMLLNASDVEYDAEGNHEVIPVQETWEEIDGEWVFRSDVVTPTCNLGGTMVYDASAERVVMWANYWEQSWSFDGTQWEATPPLLEIPSQLWANILTYDVARSRTLAMVGASAGAQGSVWHLWEHDGVNWARRTDVQAPDRRGRGALTYDSHRQRVIFVGGGRDTWDSPASDDEPVDTWEFDGVEWVEVFAENPPTFFRPGSEFLLAYDAHRRKTVFLVRGNPAEVWEYDGLRWTEITPAPEHQGPDNQVEQWYVRDLRYGPRRRGMLLFPNALKRLPRLRWEGSAYVELCGNNGDDDFDDLIDCDDPDCSVDPTCDATP